MARPPSAPKASALTEPTPAPLDDTSVADAARVEYDDDDVSPINPAVRLRLVAEFHLERRVITNGREQRVEMVGPGIVAGMSKDDVGKLCGPGEYVATWLRATKGNTADSHRPKLERYKVSVFSVALAGDASAATAAGVMPGVTAFGAPIGAPAPMTMAAGERLVPASLTLDEQWFAAWQIQAANDRAEILGLARSAMEAIGSMAQRSAEQNAAILAMSGQMVQAMHQQGRAELERSTGYAMQLVQLREQMQPSGVEAVIGKVGARLADRLVPETNAKPDEISATLAQVRAALPTITELGALAPQIRTGLARIDKVTAALGMGEEAPPPDTSAKEPAPQSPTTPEDGGTVDA